MDNELPNFRIPTREELRARPGIVEPIARPFELPRPRNPPPPTPTPRPITPPQEYILPTREELLARPGMTMPERMIRYDYEFTTFGQPFVVDPYQITTNQQARELRRLINEDIRRREQLRVLQERQRQAIETYNRAADYFNWAATSHPIERFTAPPESIRYRRSDQPHNIPPRRQE